jgi:hypothetical protein
VKIFYRNGDLATNDPSVKIFKTPAIGLKEGIQIPAGSKLVEDVTVSLVV